MKPQYILFKMLLVCIFGLISCKEEKIVPQLVSQPVAETGPPMKTPSVQKEHDPAKVIDIRQTDLRIVQTNDSYREVTDLKEIQIDSHFELVGEAKDKIVSIQTTTECKTSFEPDILSFEKSYLAGKQIYLPEILNARVFTPHEEAKDFMMCDLNLIFTLENGQNVIGDFKELHIRGALDFNNFRWGRIDQPSIKYMRISNIHPLGLDIPFEQGTLSTLCKKTSEQQFYNGNPLGPKDLFPAQLFEYENVIQCRLHFRDEKSQATYVSRLFYIQEKDPQLHSFVEFYTEAHPEMHFNQDPLLTINLENRGTEAAFVRVPKSTPQTITIVPTYIEPARKKLLKTDNFSASGRWEVVSRNKPYQRGKSNDVFKLQAGERLIIGLSMNIRLNCKNEVALRSQYGQPLPLCQNTPILAGYQFIFDPIASFRYHNFSVPQPNSWVDWKVSIPGTRSEGQKLRLWSPNHSPSSLCPSFPPQKDPGLKIFYHKHSAVSKVCQKH